MPPRSKGAQKTDGRSRGKIAFLDGLKPEEAQAVLARLLTKRPALAADAERIARSLLSEVSFAPVADKVEMAVRGVRVGALRGRAGRQEWGYVEPDQAALDLLTEAVDPFLEDMKRKLHLGLAAEALEVYKGIVLGLYRVHKKRTELLEYAAEFPEEHAAWVVDIWRAGGDEDKAARRARPLAGSGPAFPQDFVKQFVPEWGWLIPEKPSRR